MERTLQELGEELLEHCVKINKHDITNNQIQRVLKLGIFRTNELTSYLIKTDKINAIGDGRYGIL